jgi:hypothetical protein
MSARSTSETSTPFDVLRAEVERERLRADRAVAYGARLLVKLDSLEQALHDYGAHHPYCVTVLSAEANAACSCGLDAHLHEAESLRGFPRVL